VTFAAVVVFAYLCGSCPWGYWLVPVFRHEDLRKPRSGPMGPTNARRTSGRRLGIPVILLDVLKGFAPALIGVLLVSHLCGIVAAIALPVFAAIYGYPTSVVVFGVIAAAAVVFLHRANLRRLRAGTESRFQLRRPARA